MEVPFRAAPALSFSESRVSFSNCELGLAFDADEGFEAGDFFG